MVPFSVFFFALLFSYHSFVLPVFALPVQQEVAAGEASFRQVDENTLHITASDHSIIQYSSFNIRQNETVEFFLPDARSFSLNEVLGGGMTEIAGTLKANGNLLLVNPGGFHFTSSARVNAGGLITSTHPIAAGDFLAGRYIFSGVDKARPGAS